MNCKKCICSGIYNKCVTLHRKTGKKLMTRARYFDLLNKKKHFFGTIAAGHNAQFIKIIQQYQIELFSTEVDLSDTTQQWGRQTRPKHHTYKDHIYLDCCSSLCVVACEQLHNTGPLLKVYI